MAIAESDHESDLDFELPKATKNQRREQKRRSKNLKSTINTSTVATISASQSITHTSQGMQSVVQQLETISMVKQQATTTMVPPAALPPNNDQAFTQASKHFPNEVGASSKKPQASAKAIRDIKVDPSKASGGIPNPTNEYLIRCRDHITRLSTPQHLLIVIDLNGTLLYRPSRQNPRSFRMRPHAQTFLRYCVDTFTVVIWSSAQPANVEGMCATILTPDIKSRVAAIWGRDKFGLTKADFNLRVQCYKRLSKLWDNPAISESHPGFSYGSRWNQTNTVLIDDSREKARTEPHNLIEVPEWFGDLGESDEILPQVHDYLNHLSMHSNVSACLYAQPWKPSVLKAGS